MKREVKRGEGNTLGVWREVEGSRLQREATLGSAGRL